MPVGIGLSGSGFLIFFLLGALSALEDGGAIKRGPGVPEDQLTPFAGSSGGSILTVASCFGVDYDVVYRVASRLADYCAAHNDCALSLDAELRRTLESALHGSAARDGHKQASEAAVARCRGRASVNLSVFAAEHTAGDDDDQEDHDNPHPPPFSKKSGGHSRNTTNARRRSNANALSEIGLELRPGALLCDATAFKPLPQLALLVATQSLLPPGLGLPPSKWLVSDWRSPQDAIDAVAASSFNLFLSGLSLTTSFRGRPLVADGVYTDPLPVPPTAARSIRISSVPDGYALAPGSPPIFGADISPGKRTGGAGAQQLIAGLTVEEYICHALVVADPPTRKAMYDLGRREAELFLMEEGK